MKARFDPESCHTRYLAEFQARRKKSTGGWADFADDLKALAYPTLQDEAREQLAINAFLQQLSPPEVAFSVKQKRPNTLDDAVAATIELESYVSPPPANVSTTQPKMAFSPVTDDSQLKQLTRAVEHLTEQVEHLRNAGARPPRRSSRQLVHSLENAGGPTTRTHGKELPKQGN